MSQVFPSNTQIQITQQTINKLTQQYKQFETESKLSDEQFYKSNEQTYYLISTKFIKEWKTFVQSTVKCAPGQHAKSTVNSPGAMNVQLVEMKLTDFDEYELKKQIQEGVDFKFYNTAVMSIFSGYEGPRIVRRAYWSGVDKKIQMYPIKFQFVFMSKSWVELIRGDKSIVPPVLTSLGYKNQTILDLLYRLVEYSKKDQRNRDYRYKSNSAAKMYISLGFDPKSYADKLRQQQQLMTFQKMQAPGTEIKNDKMIGDLEIPKENFMLIVELQQDKWLYKIDAPQLQRCQFCRDLKKLPFECRCKQVRYCCELCRQKDWRYHARSCDAQFEEEKNYQPQFTITQKSKQGLVGLSNLGNTCYMNAALQCMIHTRALTEYFRSKNYIDQINQKNPIGSQGKLVKAYARFIQSALTTQQAVVTPTRLKHTVGKVKDMFSGYEQHDSQQFLLFMLDTLHEDLNRVLKKPFTSGVQNQGRPDEEVAKESWITYLKRNQSIINDLMGGQYRSQVKCPDCYRISVTFDPYLIFAVPIPSSQAKSINLYYFIANYNSQTLKMTLTSHNNLVKQLRQDVATKSKTEANQIMFFVSGFNGAVRKVDDSQTVDRLINEKQLNENSEQKQLFAMQYETEELQKLQEKRWFIFKFVTKSGTTLTFKRPFPLKYKTLKGSQLYDRLCQFLLNLWTKSDKKTEGKQRQTKLNVYKSKVQQQKIFRIFMVYGKATEIKNKITFEKRLQIQEGTDVSALLQENNFQVEFEVQFSQNPYYSFNSYKTYTVDGTTSSYDSGQAVKSGADENYTLYECLQEMKKSEKLVEGNEVFCTHCGDMKLAEKKMEMYKASKYLVMQLRRFKQVGYEKTKNYALVKFPSQLDLANYVISSQAPQIYFKGDEESFIKPKYWTGYDESKSAKYKLYGVVNHHGSLAGGHYTAYAKHNNNWYKFDDSQVTPVESGSIVSSAAYLLFYERQQ